jgi:uncharacterized tellurite resistance protein B-like protein
MTLRRLLGLPDIAVDAESGDGVRDTETVRRIVRALDALPPERARFLAAFAYTLTRAAAADITISEVELAAIERLVREYGGVPEAQAVLIAQIARTQQDLAGAWEDYAVTRQFRELSTEAERLALLRCCYLVGAADETITAEESTELQEIARELDLDRAHVTAIRNEFADRLSAIQAWFGSGRSGTDAG